MDQQNLKTREAPQGDSQTTEMGEGSPLRGNSPISVTGLSTEVQTLQLQGSSPKGRNRGGAEKRRRRRARELLGSGESRGTLTTGTTSDAGAQREGLPPAGGTKRGRSEAGTLSSPKRQVKRQRRPLKPTTYSQAVSSALRVAIAGKNFPESRLDRAQCGLIQDSLERAIDCLPTETPIPRFEEFKLTEQGLVIVHCSNESSKEWLKTAVGTITPWESSELLFLENEQIPRLKKMTAWVPGIPQDQAIIFKRLERQHPRLKPGLWKVYERKVISNPQGVRMILGVDSGSYEVLKSTNFQAYAGMVKVSFTDTKPAQAKGTSKPGSSGNPPGKPGTSKD